MAKTPMAAQGCLLLHDLTASEGQMLSLCHALEEEGYPVSMPNLFGFVPRDAYDRTPHWQRWLNQAQEAYVELRGVCERVTVVGAGYGGVIATVIAEEYSVDGLVLLGCVLRPAGAAAALKRWLPLVRLDGADREVRAADVGKLARLAENNLFSIVGDVLVLDAPDDPAFRPDGGQRLLEGARAKRKECRELGGTTIAELPAAREAEIKKALLQFLRGPVAQ